ncbi:T9SS type A sorting domain-containing protein [Algoriphagus sp. Y33]|uniref:T9SS type A sorting domain-containing protein n=1 Tax=Algoriphagus sp. Y33 TaxID=2772483 RepID=UPI00177C3E1C|nr:T9SS type A sorting domain-containing protein [Algoriphagus sp. Y33]
MKNLMYKVIFALFLLVPVISSFSQTCVISGHSDINVNQTKTYSTSATSGAGYFWSTTGGLTIVGSNTGTSVSVKGVSSGLGQVCVTKYKAGSEPCCECIPVDCRACPSAPTIFEGTCGGYPSVHPHWRYGLLESVSSGSGTYSWSGTNFVFDTPTNQEWVTGRPTASGNFTITCTVTYNCTPSGSVTYNVSKTIHTSDCISPFDMQMSVVYPNPVTSSATVKYVLPEEGDVNAIIMSDLGEKVAVLISSEHQDKGEYEMLISEDNFQKNGVYILNIYLNNEMISQQKIIKE